MLMTFTMQIQLSHEYYDLYAQIHQHNSRACHALTRKTTPMSIARECGAKQS